MSEHNELSNRAGIVIIIFLIFVFIGLLKFDTYMNGKVVGTNIIETVIESDVVTVDVGDAFPIQDVLKDVDDYLYQGVIEQSDGDIQLQIGKRFYHPGRNSGSYEVQEMIVNVKEGENISAIKTKFEYERYYYDIIFLGLKDNAVKVRLDKIEVTKEPIVEGGIYNRDDN